MSTDVEDLLKEGVHGSPKGSGPRPGWPTGPPSSAGGDEGALADAVLGGAAVMVAGAVAVAMTRRARSPSRAAAWPRPGPRPSWSAGSTPRWPASTTCSSAAR